MFRSIFFGVGIILISMEVNGDVKNLYSHENLVTHFKFPGDNKNVQRYNIILSSILLLFTFPSVPVNTNTQVPSSQEGRILVPTKEDANR